MTDQELLNYGIQELKAFRADMKRRKRDCAIHDHATANGIRIVLRNQSIRRKQAGLTPNQSARACIMAATYKPD